MQPEGPQSCLTPVGRNGSFRTRRRGRAVSSACLMFLWWPWKFCAKKEGACGKAAYAELLQVTGSSWNEAPAILQFPNRAAIPQ